MSKINRTKVIPNLIEKDTETYEIAYRYKPDYSQFSPRMIPAWQHMIKYALEYTLKDNFSDIVIMYVAGQPYDSADDIRDDIEKNNQLLISTDFNEPDSLSLIFGHDTKLNLLFRATHDLHHSLTGDCNFNLDGEICAFSKFAYYALQWGEIYNSPVMASNLIRVLASEIIGQVCYLRHNGNFPNQTFNYCVPDHIINRILAAYGYETI